MAMSIFPLALLCFAVLVHHSQGAERISAKTLLRHALHRRHARSGSATSYRFKREADTLPMTDVDDVMALGRDAKLDVVQETMTVQGTKVLKLQERYQGRVIPDGVVTLETDHEGRQVVDVSGHVYRNIHLDFEDGELIGEEKAKRECMEYNKDELLADSVQHLKVEEEVLFDDDGKAYPAYLVQYQVPVEHQDQRRPTCFVDARNSSIVVSWDALDTCTDCTATGVGGNRKIGKMRYGELQRCLDLIRDNGTCYLENKYVRVLNNNFTKKLTDDEGNTNTPVASYNCEEIDDEINGGYSPLLDALFYGTVVGRMFEDWYNMSPLGETMTFRVHYGFHYRNAFWNGYECSFGDGDGYFLHPMVGLDLVGHEIGHGITEKNSNLYYYQQWGGINEAFSDMTGEIAEEYIGEADWVMGYDIVTKGVPPVRYFDDPEKDFVSISHADNYTEFLDPHFGSGVYNHVFYLLVHDYGLPIREVFHVFLHANRMYWHHMSNYEQAACDVMKSAYDLGHDGSKFRKAFAEVGIKSCDAEDHVLGLKNKKVYSDIKVSKAISPTFVFSVPGEFAESVTVSSSSSSGDVYIILSDKKWGGGEDNVQVYAEGLYSVIYELKENSTIHVTITLTTDSVTPLNDVTLVAGYNCVSNFTKDDTYKSDILHRSWKKYCNVEEDEEEPDDNEDSPESEDKQEEEEKKEEEEEEEETGGEGKGKEGKVKDEMEEKDKLPSQTFSVSGHVFNFFKSFIIMVFPQSK